MAPIIYALLGCIAALGAWIGGSHLWRRRQKLKADVARAAVMSQGAEEAEKQERLKAAADSADIEARDAAARAALREEVSRRPGLADRLNKRLPRG